MWFNNRFNKDNKIEFVANEWSCTDPDEFQFCRKISDHEFEYIQLKDDEMVRDSLCLGKQILSYLNGKTEINDWYQDEIDVLDYDEDEVKEYVSPYGDILVGCNEVDRNQLIAECIFETNVISGEYE